VQPETSPTVRQVRFEYCISLVFLTWRRESEPIELRPGQSAAVASFPYCLITLLLGWWGVPWGLLLTPLVLWNNLRGGREVNELSP
jgi:hypothetical protein